MSANLGSGVKNLGSEMGKSMSKESKVSFSVLLQKSGLSQSEGDK